MGRIFVSLAAVWFASHGETWDKFEFWPLCSQFGFFMCVPRAGLPSSHSPRIVRACTVRHQRSTFFFLFYKILPTLNPVSIHFFLRTLNYKGAAAAPKISACRSIRRPIRRIFWPSEHEGPMPVSPSSQSQSTKRPLHRREVVCLATDSFHE